MELTIEKEIVDQVAKSVIDIAENINGSFTKEELIEKVQKTNPIVDAEQCAEVVRRVWLLLSSNHLLVNVKDDYYRILTDRELRAIKKAYMEIVNQNENGNN